MSYLVIAGTEYLVREGEGRGRPILVEARRRAVDGSLLVDPIAQKIEVQTQVSGLASEGRFFTVEEANAFIATLTAGAVAVTGDMGSFTARAREIGWVDEQHWPDGPFAEPAIYRVVTVTLEEV